MTDGRVREALEKVEEALHKALAAESAEHRHFHSSCFLLAPKIEAALRAAYDLGRADFRGFMDDDHNSDRGVTAGIEKLGEET